MTYWDCINTESYFGLHWQDSSKIDDLTKDCENSTNLIPKLEDSIPNLQKLLAEEEKILEEIKENAKGTFTDIFCCNFTIFQVLQRC